MWILSVIVLSICLVAAVLPWSRKQPEIPGPKGFPLVGHLRELLRPDFHRILSEWASIYGGIYRITILGLPGVVVSDPQAIAQVLGRDTGSAIPKHLASYQQLNLLWGSLHQYSIFTGSNTELWRAVRKAVSPCFSSANVRDKFDIVLRKSMSLSDSIVQKGSEQPIDMDDAGMRLTLDVVALASFGYDTCAVDFSYNSIIAALPCALTELQKRMTNPFRVLSWSKESRAAMACANQFKAACTTILQEMRTRGCDGPSNCSVGAQLLKVVDPVTGSQVSDAQLTAEIGTFLMGGFETTVHTLSFTVFCIANSLEIQDRITAELTSLGLIRGHNGKSEARGLQYEDLPKLSYLDSVLKESMRMFPVVAGFPRFCDQPTQIGQHIVPRGTFVYVLFHALHNSRRYWEDPDQFKPDRWTEKGIEYPPGSETHSPNVSSKHADSVASNFDQKQKVAKRFLPFSDGPRSCVAQAMAMMELRTALAVLCMRFHFQVASQMRGMEGLIASEPMALILHVAGGVHIHCIRRGNSNV